MCAPCMAKNGSGKGCTSNRTSLKKFKRTLTELYNNTQNQVLKNFLFLEISNLTTTLKNLKFCPTVEYVNSYKEIVNAEIANHS